MSVGITKLANEFALVLSEWLTDSEFATLKKLSVEDGTNECSSHDFCDSNAAMLAAGTRLGYINLVSDQESIRAAWELAKKNNFKLLRSIDKLSDN